jgi:hypothetical protein
MIVDDWSSSMLLFWGEERKGQRLFQKRKEVLEVTLGSRAEVQGSNDNKRFPFEHMDTSPAFVADTDYSNYPRQTSMKLSQL